MADPNNANQNALEITNTLFPPPPIYYKAFTNEAWGAYEKLGESSQSQPAPHSPQTSPRDEGTEGNENTLGGQLEPPRVDWVVEEGAWKVFGETHHLQPFVHSPESLGLPPYVDPNESPQTSLPPLLHSFLHTLLLLVDTLTNTARIPGELEERGWKHEGDQYIQHMSNLSMSMMISANQLRSVQAEATLVMLMEKQLAVRRAQTEALRSKCRAISTSIKALKSESAAI